MEPYLIQALASVIGGGLAGGVLTIFYNSWTASQQASAREKTTMVALASELAYIRLLCDHNARLEADEMAPFVRFPTNVILRATFQERQLYPRLGPLQTDLETLTLGLIQMNQLMDFRALMWQKPTTPRRPDPQVYLDDLRNLICGLCSGKQLIPQVGAGRPLELPSLVDCVTEKIEQLGTK